jgi:polyhydroxyalkanoate synthesis regulator protein
MFPQFGQPLSGPQMPGFAQRQAPQAQQPQMPQYGQQLQGLLGSLFQQNVQNFIPQQSQMIQPWMRNVASPMPQATQNAMFQQWTGPQEQR